MDSAGQAAGERRVRELLIEPLERRGLAKPAALTRAQYEAMVADLCARLAYMAEISLGALAEQVAANPAGKDRDRLPIANTILEWAGQIQPPGDDASPLIRAVFAARVGQEALDGGWAPELLVHLRGNRRWPGAWALAQIREAAASALRRMEQIETRLARGESVSTEDADFRARRRAGLDRCRQIAAMGAGVAA